MLALILKSCIAIGVYASSKNYTFTWVKNVCLHVGVCECVSVLGSNRFAAFTLRMFKYLYNDNDPSLK